MVLQKCCSVQHVCVMLNFINSSKCFCFFSTKVITSFSEIWDCPVIEEMIVSVMFSGVIIYIRKHDR